MLPKFPKIGAIWPLQVDQEQQLGHLLEQYRNLSLSFAAVLECGSKRP